MLPSRAYGSLQGPILDTFVIGAGQAGLATSYWLTRVGVEH
jgi:putative flavoprotein involved in K+ transport